MTRPLPSYAAPLAIAAAAAQVVFFVGWLVVGAAEGHGYAWARQDISDLGALTAHHATLFRLELLVTGVVTMAFGVLVFGPVLRSPLTGALVALSLPGFDNASDFFFRLDCRAADAGCSASDSFSSWHGRAHMVCFAIAALATVAAPFVMARAMGRDPAWQSAPGPVRWFGVVIIVLLLVLGALSGTPVQGLGQRIAATVVTGGVAALAVLVLRRASSPRLAGLLAGR